MYIYLTQEQIILTLTPPLILTPLLRTLFLLLVQTLLRLFPHPNKFKLFDVIDVMLDVMLDVIDVIDVIDV